MICTECHNTFIGMFYTDSKEYTDKSLVICLKCAEKYTIIDGTAIGVHSTLLHRNKVLIPRYVGNCKYCKSVIIEKKKIEEFICDKCVHSKALILKIPMKYTDDFMILIDQGKDYLSHHMSLDESLGSEGFDDFISSLNYESDPVDSDYEDKNDDDEEEEDEEEDDDDETTDKATSGTIATYGTFYNL